MEREIIDNIKKIKEISDIKTETLKAIEELSELIRVLSRIVDADFKTFSENRNNLVEEIADVTIMLMQLQEFYKISIGEIYDVMNYKVERTLERLCADDKG